jgi:hypothetical protein
MAKEPTIKEVLAELKRRGASPIDYRHLSFEDLKKLVKKV